jgi:hypothetical protein
LIVAASASLAELGPVLPSRCAVHAQAVEMVALAKRAVEFSGTWQTADLGLALKQFEHMRAILGPGAQAAGSGGPRCGCPRIVVERVLRGGTCGRGGCPYGGDF